MSNFFYLGCKKRKEILFALLTTLWLAKPHWHVQQSTILGFYSKFPIIIILEFWTFSLNICLTMVFVGVDEEEDTLESSFCLNIWTPLDMGDPSSPPTDDRVAGASSVGRAVRHRSCTWNIVCACTRHNTDSYCTITAVVTCSVYHYGNK